MCGTCRSVLRSQRVEVATMHSALLPSGGQGQVGSLVLCPVLPLEEQQLSLFLVAKRSSSPQDFRALPVGYCSCLAFQLGPWICQLHASVHADGQDGLVTACLLCREELSAASTGQGRPVTGRWESGAIQEVLLWGALALFCSQANFKYCSYC